MKVIYYVLFAIIIVVIIVAIGYYFKMINSYKKFIMLEKELMETPSDEAVDVYIKAYSTSYIPNTPKILAYRTRFYLNIKKSENVSYRKKKELLDFFKEKGIPVFSKARKVTENDEDVSDIEDFDADIDVIEQDDNHNT